MCRKKRRWGGPAHALFFRGRAMPGPCGIKGWSCGPTPRNKAPRKNRQDRPTPRRPLAWCRLFFPGGGFRHDMGLFSFLVRSPAGRISFKPHGRRRNPEKKTQTNEGEPGRREKTATAPQGPRTPPGNRKWRFGFSPGFIRKGAGRKPNRNENKTPIGAF